MIYATANRQDVPLIARVLMESFADSFHRVYGKVPPVALFEHAVALVRDVEPKALLVAYRERTVVGFVFAPHSLAAMRRVSLLRGHILRWLWQWPLGWRRMHCSPLHLLLPFNGRTEIQSAKWWQLGEARILTVAVSPTARGQGVGTTLVRHALAYLRRRHVQTVRVELPLEEPQVQRLFLAAGFLALRAGQSDADQLVMLYDFQSAAAASAPAELHA